MLFSSLASVFALAATANAHGYIAQFVADGKTYKGGVPAETNPKSAIRSISTINPYKDPKGTGITCGAGAKNAALVAPVTAGSKMTMQWVAHPGQAWPHEMGPLITYMAKVPAGQTADKFNAAQGDFFKIQQTGQEGKGWAVAKQMKLGTNYEVTVPKAIENGDYIMRHEIIALHLADKKGGAEFYTSCYQLRVTGGTGSGAVTPTVKFPGAYSATDPGIFAPKVFDSGFKYQFPGPAIPKFAAGIASSNSTSSNSSASASTEPSVTVSETAPEATDDCTDEEPTSTGSAATPTATDDEECSDEEPATSSSKAPKPTGKKHNEYRRAQAAARGWASRMEKRYVGAPAAPRS